MKIWTNVNYSEAAMNVFSAGIAAHELVTDVSAAEAVFGFTGPEHHQDAPHLRWIQVPAAGYEKFDTAEGRAWLKERGIALTNSSSVYNEPCAQHVLAMLMALARRIPQACALQAGDHSWPQWTERAEIYLPNGKTVLLLSYGAIARRLCELLAPLQMNVIAVRRTPTGDEPIKTITAAELPDYLPIADHVINILPANPATTNFMNAERFAQMKRGAIYYNIGRGTTTDQEALVAALQSGQLSYAYLDVTNPEPLPPEHVLWTTPNCYLTPHTAGGHHNEHERLVRLFLENLRRLTAGEELLDRIV
jgi:phosphoglycerate dehydrogenase-like enzyme